MPPYNKILNGYVTLQNYNSAGIGHIGWFVNSAKNTAYILAGLFFLGIDIPSELSNKIWFMGILTVGNLSITLLIGWLWDYYKGYHIQNEWGNKRNPMLQKINDNVESFK
jgi:hypothetical protein|tara:strand:+ start:418 stop:747 length:330 start_codon:yes stop_codon:yes gene_type:complete